MYLKAQKKLKMVLQRTVPYSQRRISEPLRHKQTLTHSSSKAPCKKQSQKGSSRPPGVLAHR